MKTRFFFVFLTTLCSTVMVCAQGKDSSRLRVNAAADTAAAVPAKPDSTARKKHDPRKATIRSAILPGWGQAYNRKYWKIPIVYAALGITGYIFNYNRIQYNKVKYAYFAVINRTTPDSIYFPVGKVSPDLKGFVDANDAYSLQLYRREFRKDIDYSVLFFLFFWALNVVDATVDGHLKDFDISNDLSMKLKPAFYTTPGSPLGLGLVFTIGKHPARQGWQMP